MAYYQQPPAAPGGDLNAKYAAANAELNQLYTLAASALPVNPDGVLQALVTCRTTIQALLSGGPPPAATPPPAAPAAPAPVPPADPAAPPPPPPGQQPVMAPPPPPGQTAMPAYAPPPGQAMPAYAPPPQTHMYAPPPPAMSGHAQGGAPPPPPAVLMPAGTYQQYHAPPPPPPEQANFDRSIYERHGWPARSYHKSLGEAIFQSQETPGNVRHEVVIEKRCIGRILGKGGRDLAAMKEASGSEVFIIDKEPPPGVDEDHRLVILVGTPDCVNACLVTVNKTLERARNELPPLPPPLSSGWRPVPSVGADLGWQHQQDNGRKRDRDDH